MPLSRIEAFPLYARPCPPPFTHLQVTVKNNIDLNAWPHYYEGISIHWHGLSLKGFAWMDGTKYVTQCPIASGSSFTYKFQVRMELVCVEPTPQTLVMFGLCCPVCGIEYVTQCPIAPGSSFTYKFQVSLQLLL